MADRDVEDHIRSRKEAADSTDDQIDIAHGLWAKGIGPDEEGLKAKEIEDKLGLDLDYNVKTSLGHLEDLGLVDEYLPAGPETLVFASWRGSDLGEVILGEVDEAAEEGIEALIDHIQDDDIDASGDEGATAVTDGGRTTVRTVVADRFDLAPDAVEAFLRRGDQVDKLNDSVEAIDDHGAVDTRDDYGEINFINQAYRYRLTDKAVRLYQ